MHIVLIEPEIPQNTGNIARTCAATGSILHLVGKLGFSIDDAQVKRAGLDYWHLVDVRTHATWEDCLVDVGDARCHFLTTKASKSYTKAIFSAGDALVFGKETKGLPSEMLAQYEKDCFRIPMVSQARSLNLANSVAVVLYESLRQQGFEG